MKKGLIIIAATAAVVAVYFLLFYNKSDKPADEPKQQPLAQSKNSEEFNAPFNQMLNSYFDIKNALVEWDTAKASTARNPVRTPASAWARVRWRRHSRTRAIPRSCWTYGWAGTALGLR